MDQFEIDARHRAQISGQSPASLFLDASRRRILTDLMVHVTDGAGPMLLVGDVGSGKTTLLRRVAEEAATQDIPVIFPANAGGGAGPLFAMLAASNERLAGDGTDVSHFDGADASEPRPSFPRLDTRRPTAILIDDAEAYPISLWHQVANLVRSHAPHATMPPLILTVTSDMLDWLNSVTLFGEQATDDRVRRLQPMVPADVCRYIAHCLKVQGHSRALIPPSAVARIAVATRGLPGPITRFCDELLTLPTVRKGGEITDELIASLTAGFATLQPGSSPNPSAAARAPEAAEAAAPSTVELPPATSYATTKPACEDMPPQGTTDVPPLRRFTAAESAWAGTARYESADLALSALSGRGKTATPSPFYDDKRRSGTLFQKRRRHRWQTMLVLTGTVGIATVAIVAVLMVLSARPSTDTGATAGNPDDQPPTSSPMLSQPQPSSVPLRRGGLADTETNPSQAAQSLAAQSPSAANRLATPLARTVPVPRSEPFAMASPLTASPTQAPTPAGEQAREPDATHSPPAPAQRPNTTGAPSPSSATLSSPSRRPASAMETKATAKLPDTSKAKDSATAARPAAGKANGKDAKSATQEDEGSQPEETTGGDANATETPTPPRPVSEIIAMGDEFRASGDLPWARKFYQAAQDRGSAKATAALAQTYDPRYVDNQHHPDPAMARQLYGEAARHGDSAATKQLQELDRWLEDSH